MSQLNHRKLIELVQENALLWDRNDYQFRNAEAKAQIWEKIAQNIGSSASTCKHAFKSLREKYVREKEKSVQYGEEIKKWELLDAMAFLDAHIVLRKGNQFRCVSMNLKEDGSSFKDQFDNNEFLNESINHELIKELICLVKESHIIWDKRHLNHGDARVREYLWRSIGQKLNTDPNVCKLRWKALREKYIRQKHRQSFGEFSTWQFMEDMSFLDSVIQLRKKKWTTSNPNNSQQAADSESSTAEAITIGTDSDPDDRTSDSYKQLHHFNFAYDKMCEADQHGRQHMLMQHQQQQQVKSTPDSTLTGETVHPVKRQRTYSSCSSAPEVVVTRNATSASGKKENINADDVTTSKSPEQIFGEFVAATLAMKSGSDRNRLMMKIMSVLTESFD